MATQAVYLSAAENEVEPDGDDDDGAFQTPAHANVVPTSGNNLPIILDSPPTASGIAGQAQEIANAEAGTLGGTDHVSWTAQADGTVNMDVQSSDQKTIYNKITINPNGETDNTTLLSDGTGSSTYSFVGASGPDVPWQTLDTDANGVPTGDLIRNGGGSKAELAEQDVNGQPVVSNPAFYDQNSQDQVGVAHPNTSFSPTDTSTIVNDSTMYGLTQSLNFIKDDSSTSSDVLQNDKTTLSGASAISAAAAKDPSLSNDTAKLENDYKTGANPTADLNTAGHDFAVAVAAAVVAAGAIGVVAPVAGAAAVVAGAWMLKNDLQWIGNATSNYMSHLFDQVYDRNGGVPVYHQN
jgi:hypothetical protein